MKKQQGDSGGVEEIGTQDAGWLKRFIYSVWEYFYVHGVTLDEIFHGWFVSVFVSIFISMIGYVNEVG